MIDSPSRSDGWYKRDLGGKEQEWGKEEKFGGMGQQETFIGIVSKGEVGKRREKVISSQIQSV